MRYKGESANEKKERNMKLFCFSIARWDYGV